MLESERHQILRIVGAGGLAALLGGLLAIISPSDLSKAAPDLKGVTISGYARIVDGDTLEIDKVRIRLEGIDAPEAGQTCSNASRRRWECGIAATRELADMTAGREVHCTGTEYDSYGRLIAICYVGSLELNAEMVRRGLAWAFVRYSRRLAHVEADARKMRVGIWQGDNQPAWSYRAEKWSAARSSAPSGCVIKGNVTNKGRIYHMPWSRFYDSVHIDPSRGERWFCSEEEARAAGWRPAYTN